MLPMSQAPRTAMEVNSVQELCDRKWQAVCYADHNFSKTFRLPRNQNVCKQLRSHPMQIAEWMADLLARGVVKNRTELARYLCLSRTQVDRYLGLLSCPPS